MGTGRVAVSDGIEVIVEAPEWETIGLGQLAARAIGAALRDAGLDPARAEVAVLACADARIGALNGQFRDKDAATNVLAFPAQELGPQSPGAAPAAPAGPALGDIAIAWETCAREAADAGKPVTDHATHLLVHATLHLLGYRHDAAADAARMEGREARILAALGLPDPYDGGPTPGSTGGN
jgi:probable rRNA maturation factor